MAPELFRVRRIDSWPPAFPGGGTVWIIKGDTIEDDPRPLTLKTVDAWKAALLERLHTANRLAWVTWHCTLKGDDWLGTVKPDETVFRHDEKAS